MDLKKHRWLKGLADEDIAFVRRFILASGSLKEIAAAYQVSYPTIRLRMDRLIQKIELLEEDESLTEFEQILRLQLADGNIAEQTFRVLLDAYMKTHAE